MIGLLPASPTGTLTKSTAAALSVRPRPLTFHVIPGVAASQDYLKREGVRVDQLRQMSLDKLGVAGTPTMLLLNNSGIVTKSWVGKLNPEEQSQALKAIGAAT